MPVKSRRVFLLLSFKEQIMIPRKKKICKSCGEPRYLFGKGMCESCYRKSRAYAEVSDHVRNIVNKASASPVEPPKYKSNGKIPLHNKKRSTQALEYNKIIKEMDQQKGIVCFFCGGKMKEAEDHHHIYGRDGDRLTDRANIVHAHRDCHSSYHDQSVHNIHWYVDWLERISLSHPELYDKELIKYNK
jgi:hypothetical protein